MNIVQERYNGFANTLKNEGVVAKSFCKKIYKSNIEFISEIGIEQFAESDFIFCFNDALAFEVISFLNNSGIKDKIVIGVDCVQKEMHLPFSMSSIGIDKQKASKLIIDELILQISGKQSKINDIIIDAEMEKFNF